MEERTEGGEVSVGADVDVRSLMDEVRAEVKRKRDQGLYPPEVLEELDTLDGTRGRDDLLALSLLRVRQSAGFSTAVTTASQMGLAAPIASSFKRIVRGSVRWYLTGILQQVEEFAANIVHTVTLLADRVRSLESKVDGMHAMEAEIRDLRDLVEGLTARVDSVETEASTVRARDRLPMVERAIREFRDRPREDPERPPPPRAESGRSWKVDRGLDYLDFENRFLGSEEDRRVRQSYYVDLFRDVPGRVVDLGCGRGEFLEVLGAAGVDCYGIDRHPDMLARCREKNLDVVDGDVLEHMAAVPPGSLGGVFSAQMIEHLEIDDVPRFFELAADAIGPGGRLVVETLNPQSLYIFAWAFYIDLGHLRPLHPLTLQYLTEKVGFSDVHTEFFFPPPAEIRPAEIGPELAPGMGDLVSELNQNFRRLDDVVFGPQDFAIVATR